ncbi:RNA exonuclease 5 isoform X2 [Esox lucius]|uniref:RRM domain-containing protein n=1 Tax=Esox lucius TaxID=8010 RepID=A0A3P9A2N5_ESOLU|nr:RNA exonuclease 5 isoform X2 [Esox lucius]
METSLVGCVKRKREPSPTQKSRKRVKETEGSLSSSPSPGLSVPFHRFQEPVTLKDLTELLQYAVLGNTMGLNPPSWCRLHHQKRVSGVSVVVLDGLSQAHFYRHYLHFRHLRTNYTCRRSYTPSLGNVTSGIFSSEVVGTQNPSVIPEGQQSAHPEGGLQWHPVIRQFGLETRGLTGYLLSPEEMIKNHFPVHGMPGTEGFVSTDSSTSVTDCSPLYGLDCEMCLTKNGNELTRVSLVDCKGSCVLDELVKPPNPIFHYLTKFSGITPAMLKPVTTTLRDVQLKLKKVLPQDAVLVGHSLENDLRALKLIHCHVIDTSLLYRKEFGQRFKLKVLAHIVLKKEIQMEDRLGHDPTEDALASLELAQYFIRTGPRKVVELFCEELWGKSLAMYQPPVSTPTHGSPNLRFDEALKTYGKSVVFIGKRSDITLALSNQQWQSSDREVLSSFRRGLTSRSFSVVQFSSFSDHLKSTDSSEQHYKQMSVRLREMCMVFAGPLPSDYTEKHVKRLFNRCGLVRTVRLLSADQRVHAEVEFELLEGAVLALETLDGAQLHTGHIIKVQRPVKESMLDFEVYLSSLQEDLLNANVIYATGLKANGKTTCHTTQVNGTLLETEANTTIKSNVIGLNANVAEFPAKVNGSQPHAQANHSVPFAKGNGTLQTTQAKLAEANSTGLHGKAKFAKLSSEVNGTVLRAKAMLAKISAEANGAKPSANSAGPSEQDLCEAFGHYGTVKGVILPPKHCGQRKRRRHAFIKYDHPGAVEAVLTSPMELWDMKVSTCRALTPPHLRSWVTMATTRLGRDYEETPDTSSREIGGEEQVEVAPLMRRLDRRVGKLFRALPDNTLSLVLLPGYISSHGDNVPGLCFLHVKR